jgi:Cytochrome c oxidase subunit IV
VTTGAKIFLGSAAFGATVGALYWVVAREPAGTVLLAFFAGAPLFVATYLWRGARDPRRPPEDRPDADPSAFDGREVGTLIPHSAWPVILGLAALLVGGGLVFGVWLLLPAAALFAVATIGFAAE